MVEYLSKPGLIYLWGKLKVYIASSLPSPITSNEMDSVLEESEEEEEEETT